MFKGYSREICMRYLAGDETVFVRWLGWDRREFLKGGDRTRYQTHIFMKFCVVFKKNVVCNPAHFACHHFPNRALFGCPRFLNRALFGCPRFLSPALFGCPRFPNPAFLVSPLPGTTKARPRKRGYAKRAEFRKRGHAKRARFSKLNFK